jgi:hypothetical protein
MQQCMRIQDDDEQATTACIQVVQDDIPNDNK